MEIVYSGYYLQFHAWLFLLLLTRLLGGSTISGAGSVTTKKLGFESELVPRDSKKNISIKENNKTYGLFKLR